MNVVETYGPITKYGFDFKGGYTDIIGIGDGDFLLRIRYGISKYQKVKLLYKKV